MSTVSILFSSRHDTIREDCLLNSVRPGLSDKLELSIVKYQRVAYVSEGVYLRVNFLEPVNSENDARIMRYQGRMMNIFIFKCGYLSEARFFRKAVPSSLPSAPCPREPEPRAEATKEYLCRS